jgi:tetratricopeptide (TPR) repeat protein
MPRLPRFVPAFAFAVLSALGVSSALAQNQNQSLALDLPLASQRASVSQRLGLTTIRIDYHRPLTRGRKVWGELVPWGQVWRAGANENTVISFTDPVAIEGQPLEKGTYGLHMIPTESSWTVIFSKNSTSWGSFTYDQKEDALRVTVKPAASEMHEALTYDFDELAPDSTAVTMRWEKLAVPFRISVDVPKTTMENLKLQLRGLQQYSWVGWNDAATYSVENKVAYDEALKWADASIQNEERFENLDTKSQLLRLTGKAAEADATLQKAIEKANPLQLHNYGRRLLAEKKTGEAMKIFQRNAQKNPTVWFVYVGLARGQCATGDFKSATKNGREALARAPEPQKKYLQGLVEKLEAGKDINS